MLYFVYVLCTYFLRCANFFVSSAFSQFLCDKKDASIFVLLINKGIIFQSVCFGWVQKDFLSWRDAKQSVPVNWGNIGINRKTWFSVFILHKLISITVPIIFLLHFFQGWIGSFTAPAVQTFHSVIFKFNRKKLN